MQDVALDACCLINLCAAGKILCPPPSAPAKARRRAKAPSPAKSQPGFGLRLHIPSTVTAETLYIIQPDEEDPAKLLKQSIDLQECVAAGLLIPCDLQCRAEVDLFVQMAAQLGDGEAACFAIAMHRDWALATDDRRARRLAAAAGLAVVTTPELVKHWAQYTGVTDEQVADVLLDIQRFAYFTPPANSPEHAWWMDCLDKAHR